LADQLSGRANNIRNSLGQSGILKSGEFGDEFPGMEGYGGLSTEDTLETSKKGFAYMQNQAKQRVSDAYIGQSAISKFGHRLGPVGKHLQQVARKRADELAGRNKEKRGINEYYTENGFINVKAKNGR
jgi:hypothetical protein